MFEICDKSSLINRPDHGIPYIAELKPVKCDPSRVIQTRMDANRPIALQERKQVSYFDGRHVGLPHEENATPPATDMMP
jgi:hypothetical protein